MLGVDAVIPTRSVGSSKKSRSRRTSTIATSKCDSGVTAASDARLSVGTSSSHGIVMSFTRKRRVMGAFDLTGASGELRNDVRDATETNDHGKEDGDAP